MEDGGEATDDEDEGDDPEGGAADEAEALAAEEAQDLSLIHI